MSEEKNAVKKLKKLGKSYDAFFVSLQDASKMSDKGYHFFKHVYFCGRYLVDFLKAQNAILRWLITVFAPLSILLFAYLKKKHYLGIINSLSTSTLVVAGVFLLLFICWWIDRNTLMKATEPTDNLFHIGAYEKFRNKEYKRNHDYFQGDPLSFEELSKEVDDIMKEEKEDHKSDVEFYKKQLDEKDGLLMKSLQELSDIEQLFNDYSVRHYKLDKIFQEVLIKMANLSQRNLNVNELDFHHYFTVHKSEPLEYRLLYAKHPHMYKVGVNHSKKVSSHLLKAEQTKDYFIIKDTLISFVIEGVGKEKWIVTLYPKPKTPQEMQTRLNYDTLYLEDIISLWKSFIALLDAQTNPIKPKGESPNVKKASNH